MSDRPKAFSDDIALAASKLLVPAVMEWLGRDAEHTDEEELARDIAKAARYRSDGYELARELEHAGYGADAELVEILDVMAGHRWAVHEKAIAAWVLANGIVPDFAVGDRVSSRHGEGEIVQIRRETAQYVVKCDAEAKVRGDGYVGTYIDYEDAKKLEVATS